MKIVKRCTKKTRVRQKRQLLWRENVCMKICILQGVHKIWVNRNFTILFIYVIFYPQLGWMEHVMGETYLNMLRDKLMPQIERLGEELPDWFQQDGAPSHYATTVRDWLNGTFPHWIGRRGHVEWYPRSPDLSPLDFFFWGMLKEKFT